MAKGASGSDLGRLTCTAAMTNSCKTELRNILHECSVALFDAYGIQIVRVDAADGPANTTSATVGMAGVIGFTHEQVRGTLMIATSQKVLSSSQTSSGAATPSQRDWISELANQLLGRMKNQLVRRGIELKMTTPVSIRGEQLSIGFEDERLIVSRYAADGEPIHAFIDYDANANFIIPEASNDTHVAAEGELLLF